MDTTNEWRKTLSTRDDLLKVESDQKNISLFSLLLR